MVQQFIGRNEELAFLTEKYSSKEAEFIVIYGRRRVGKTELIRQFSRDKPHIYFQCERSEPKIIIREFQARLAGAIGEESFGKLRLSGWYELFEEAARLPPLNREDAAESHDKFIIIFDEFPYLAETDSTTTSVFQKLWDQLLSKLPVMLILCGSSMGMMEREVLSAKSPLFGRRTGQILLKALTPFEIKEFFPGYSFEDVLRVFGVCDGIPAYVRKFDPGKSFARNLEDRVLNKNEYLYAEGEFLLKSEFREYRKYFILLSLLAKGKRSFNELTTSSGLDKGLVSKYLSKLQALKLVTTDHPVTVRYEKSRKARYRITDHFLMFWFRFIFAKRHQLEEFGSLELGDVQKEFSVHMGFVFEQVCREYIKKNHGKGYPFVGSWWNRKGQEIDVVALDIGYRNAILGECKWGGGELGTQVFWKLLEKQRILESEHPLESVRYLLFSGRGFSDELKDMAGRRDDLQLADMRALETQNTG